MHMHARLTECGNHVAAKSVKPDSKIARELQGEATVSWLRVQSVLALVRRPANAAASWDLCSASRAQLLALP